MAIIVVSSPSALAYSPLDSERGRIDMHLLGCDAKNLAGTVGNASKQLREIVGVQPVQGAP